MNFASIVRKQIALFSLIIIVSVITVAGLSYAIFTHTDSNTTNQIIETADLDVAYGESGSLVTGDILPLDETSGLEETGYSVALTNNIDYPLLYTVTLYNNSPANFAGQLLDYQYVRISFDGAPSVPVNTLTNFNGGTNQQNTIYLLSQATIPVGDTSIDHTIRVWLDENTPPTESGKYVYLQMKVTSEIAEP